MGANYAHKGAEMHAKGDFARALSFHGSCSMGRKFHVLCLFFVGNMWNERFVL